MTRLGMNVVCVVHQARPAPPSPLDPAGLPDQRAPPVRLSKASCRTATFRPQPPLVQPRFSIFRMFDDVMLLGKGGRLVFLGPSRLALPYFDSIGFQLPPNENPAGGADRASTGGDSSPATQRAAGRHKGDGSVHASLGPTPLPPATCHRTADFLMDVICGAVPRQHGAAAFQPADLFDLWLSHGLDWVQLHAKLASKGEGGRML